MATIYASVTGGTVIHEGQELRTFKLQTAINRLIPGDVLEVLPGRYVHPVRISQGGRPGAPIIIRGNIDGGTIFDGEQERESANDDFDPTDDGFSFIKIIDADWVDVNQISFKHCWPSSIFIRGAKHIQITDCRIEGGRFAIYARNRRLLRKSRHIALRRLKWVQDVDHDMWDGRTTWMDVKQQKPTQNDARYFNGALFGSYDIKGPVTIEGCDVSHAFNGIRIDAKSSDLSRGRNSDIHIIGNRFSFIRDNAVEPEKIAERLYVLNNAFFNVHATFSFDGVAGKHWYYIGNRLLNVQRPGISGQPNQGGKIFKFHSSSPYPVEGFYALFNSIQTRTEYIKSGQTRSLVHANNAIGICRYGQYCDQNRKLFGDDFKWNTTLTFFGDLCDHPDFPGALNHQGYKVAGIHTPDGVFDLPATGPDGSWDGQLGLKHGSPGQNASKELSVRLPNDVEILIDSGFDMGAPAPPELLTALIPEPGKGTVRAIWLEPANSAG